MVIVSKQLTVPSTGKQLSDYVEGDIIKIPESGTPVEFYVAKHNYESELNGTGKTLVVRKEGWTNVFWSMTSNYYETSNLDSVLNSEYINNLNNIINLIENTKFYFTNADKNVSILERKIFLLSVTEFGLSNFYANIEGSKVPIADMLKIMYYNGMPEDQWTRSPFNSGTTTCNIVQYNGRTGDTVPSTPLIARPVFTLPSTTKFDSNTNVIIG